MDVPETALSLTCVRDDATREVMRRVNESGEAYLTHTVLADQVVLRVAIGAERTEDRHIERLCELLDGAA